MPRFKFQLDPLLKARKLTEQEKQRTVAAIERERTDLEASLRSAQKRISDGKGELRDQLTGTVNAQLLRWQASATMQQMREAQRIVLSLAGVHRRLETARAELVEAARQRRAIELLRERRFEQWKADQERLENEFIDELSVIAAARARRDHV